MKTEKKPNPHKAKSILSEYHHERKAKIDNKTITKEEILELCGICGYFSAMVGGFHQLLGMAEKSIDFEKMGLNKSSYIPNKKE